MRAKSRDWPKKLWNSSRERTRQWWPLSGRPCTRFPFLRRGLSAKPWISAVFESCSTWEAAPVPSTSNFVGDTRTCQRWYMTCRSWQKLPDAQFPAGHDVILLSMIMHDWSEADDQAIPRKCYEALPKGGAVVISELLVNDDKTGPAPAALMSLNMLVETVGGRNYTPAEYSAWLNEVDFRDVRVVWLKRQAQTAQWSDTNANSRPRNRALWRSCASRAATHNYPNRRLLRRSPDYFRPSASLHLSHLRDEQAAEVRSNFLNRRYRCIAVSPLSPHYSPWFACR